MMHLYLTNEEKLKHLEKFLEHYDKDEDLIDLDMIPTISRFVMIQGVCPVESCTGHKTAMWELTGYISLAFTERMYMYFMQTCLQPLLHMHDTIRVKINLCRDWRGQLGHSRDFSIRPHVEISWRQIHWGAVRDIYLPRLAETLRQRGGSE